MKYAGLLVLVLSLGAAPATREAGPRLKNDAPQAVREYYDKCLDQVSVQIKSKQDQFDYDRRLLASVRTAKIDPSAARSSRRPTRKPPHWKEGEEVEKQIFSSVREREASVKEIQGDLADLRRQIDRLSQPGAMGDVPLMGHGAMAEELHVGNIGHVGNVRVVMRRSKTEAIVEIAYLREELDERGRFARSVLMTRYSSPAWIVVDDTSKLADGEIVDVDRDYEVVGTKMMGAGTYFELHPFDLSKFLENP